MSVSGLPQRDPVNADAPRERRRRDLLYPDRYAWYVLVSSLDVILTITVIEHFGARELNTLAEQLLMAFGAAGLIALKVATMIVVVLICDYVGRRKYRLGKRLSEWAIALSAVPVAVSLIQVSWVSTGIWPIETEPPEENTIPLRSTARDMGQPAGIEQRPESGPEDEVMLGVIGAGDVAVEVAEDEID